MSGFGGVRAGTPRLPSGEGEDPEGPDDISVEEVMTRSVLAVAPDTTLLDALRRMRRRNVSGVPVVDAGGRVVGVLSERDLARFLVGASRFPGLRGLLDVFSAPGEGRVAAYLRGFRDVLGASRVAEAMTAPPQVIEPDDPVIEAARRMTALGINRLPVVRDGRLVGIVSRQDLLRALARPLPR